MIGKLYILNEKIRLNMRMIKYRFEEFLKRVWKKKEKEINENCFLTTGYYYLHSNKIYQFIAIDQKCFPFLKKKKILKITILELLFKFYGTLAHTNILNNFMDKYNYSIELTLFLKNNV